jgi:hypothetical protein
MSNRFILVAGVAAVSIAAAAIPRHMWTANLQPVGVRGEVTVDSPTTGEAKVTIALKGGAPSTEYPWHVHAGTCATGGAIVGGADRYAGLSVGAEGTSTGSATVRALDGTKEYHVNVHRSRADMTVISCGNLKLETTK